jgi:hypothetical protein
VRHFPGSVRMRIRGQTTSLLKLRRPPSSPPGAAGGRHAVSLPQECHGQVRVSRKGPLGDTVAASMMSPVETEDCQASVTSHPKDWPLWQFSLGGKM